MPQLWREEQARVKQANAMLDAKLKAVRSNIPMNRAVKVEQNALMDNYRKFSSKYNAEKPKLDPLLAQKLKREVRDTSPGTQMLSMHN